MAENSKEYPSLFEAFVVWVKIAVYSFGGPANQIAVMHKLIVEEKKWIGEQRFLHALNYCMLLPGPEAQQLAIYLGWLLHRYWGGIIAGSLFVLPGFITILPLSIIYAKYHSFDFIKILFYGIKPAVIVIVLEALLRIGQKALNIPISYTIALVVFI
ncbi:chromate transporter, partial [Legionella parisiensis]